MKTQILYLLVVALFFAPVTHAQTSAETLFDAKCASCHTKMIPDDISTLTAPPVMGMMRHVKMMYDSKEEAVKFIAEYALDPQESKAVCMAEKIKRFGLMPSQKGNVSREELTLIAGWMYDNFGSPGQGNRNCQNGNCKGKSGGPGNGKACRGQ